MQPISEKEKKILKAIEQTLANEGNAPTVRELAEVIDASSPHLVSHYLDQLENKGYIRRNSDFSRNIVLLADSKGEKSDPDILKIPLVGWTAGGSAIWSEQNIEEWIPISRRLFRFGSNEIFLLKVKGNSMAPEIEDGDMIVVKKQYTADPGQKVVALLGNETTVKKYLPREDHILLQPSNPKYEPIVVFPDEVRIQGVVEGVLKYY